MAKVTVEGVVSRVNRTGNGFGVKESATVGDRQIVTYWSVFPPKDASVNVAVDQSVKVSGFIRAKVSERDPRYVDFTVNHASVEAGAAPAPAYAGDQSWLDQPNPAYGDDTPF
jgi:hypothetical protein